MRWNPEIKRTCIILLQYLVAWPLVICYIAVSYQPTYTHYRSVLINNMHRLYEKEAADRDDMAFALLQEKKIPKMPAREMN